LADVTTPFEAEVTEVFHREWGRVVATLIRRTGDWDLAEDSAQEAFVLAVERWRRDGIPASPGGWLTATALNRAIDRLRRAAVGRQKLRELAAMTPAPDSPDPDESGIADDRLRLIFTCCHPALALDARVALTLRSLAGLTTSEIARAFLVTDATMAKRLVRAKAKIAHTGIPYRVPPAHLLAERTTGVLAVIYLLFNEGYEASTGADLVRAGLCDEATRLGRTLTELMPEEPEVLGLLALLLFHDSRRAGRVDASGDLVPLDEQDRTRWNAEAISEAVGVLDRALRLGRPGPYQTQAAIAACHATAPDAAATDWAEIAGLYGELGRMTGSPVVELNRAVAVAMADGPQAGLRLVDGLADTGALRDYRLLAATQADLLRRLGRRDEAAEAYRRALDLAGNERERRFLTRRLSELGAPARP
jgi:RNA polymerase sigma-70 factor (ECF subfamily)